MNKQPKPMYRWKRLLRTVSLTLCLIMLLELLPAGSMGGWILRAGALTLPTGIAPQEEVELPIQNTVEEPTHYLDGEPVTVSQTEVEMPALTLEDRIVIGLILSGVHYSALPGDQAALLCEQTGIDAETYEAYEALGVSISAAIELEQAVAADSSTTEQTESALEAETKIAPYV